MLIDPDLQRQIQEARRPDRLYPIQSNKYYGFYAGHLRSGEQALVTLDRQNTIRVHLFNDEGSFLRVEQATAQFTKIVEEPFLSVNDEDLHQWLAEQFGFSPGLIRINESHDSRADFDIEPFPRHFDDFIAGRPTFTAEQIERYPQYIRQWCQERDFVLNYNNDYWLDDTGEVTSS